LKVAVGAKHDVVQRFSGSGGKVSQRLRAAPIRRPALAWAASSLDPDLCHPAAIH
jgi:hypothetical protein